MTKDAASIPPTEPIGFGWWRHVEICPHCRAIRVRYVRVDDMLWIRNSRPCVLCNLRLALAQENQ